MTEGLRAVEDQLADAAENPEAFAELTEQLWEDGEWRSVLELYRHCADESAEFVDFGRLVEGLTDYVQGLESGAEQNRIWTEIGDLCCQRLEDVEAGLEAYLEAFEAYDGDVTPLRRAQQLYRDYDEWGALVDVYRTELAVVDDTRRSAQLLGAIAQVRAERLGDFDEALSVLERLDEAAEAPFVDQLRELYEREATIEEGIEEALEMAEVGLNDESGDVAADAFLEAARLEANRLNGDTAEALRLARRGLDADDERPQLEALVEGLDGEEENAVPSDETDETSAQEDGDSSLDEESAAPAEDDDDGEDGEDDEEQRSVEAFWEAVESFDGTVEEAREALESDRTDLGALKKVRDELHQQGDVAGLVEVLEDSVRYFRKEEGEWEVMTELANLYWLELGDDEEAEYYFKRLKLLDEHHPDVFKFYEAYYEDRGDWRKLFTLLQGRIEHIDDRDDCRMEVERLAEIAEYELNSPQKAIDVWKNFLRQFPDDDQGRRSLRQLYRDHEKFNALTDLLKQRVRDLEEEGQETVDERISLLEEMAQIYRVHLQVDTMVMNIMSQILELDPDHPEAFGRLRELYEENRRFKDLAELLAETADRAAERGSVGTAVDRLLEAADIWEDRLNNQTEAIPHLERIVEISPRETDVREKLRGIYEKRRDFESLFDLRLEEAGLLDGDERVEELNELLEMARNDLGDQRREARVLEALVEQNQQLAQLDELQEVRRELEDWSRVAELLEQRAELVEGDEAIDALAEAARIQGDDLEDDEEAVRLWRLIRDRDPAHEEAFEALSAIFVQRGDYDELETLYDDGGSMAELYELFEAVSQERPKDGAELHRRRARIAEEQLEEPPLVVEALEALVDVAEDPDEVRRELLYWYDRVGDLDGEIEVRTTLLESEDDEDDIFAQQLTIAELEERRGDPEAGLGWAMKSFEMMPDRSRAFERTEELARQAGMLEAVVTRAMDIIESIEDDELRDRLLGDCGRILWRDLGDLESAVELYETLRERHPGDLDVLEALEALYDETDRADDRMDVLETQIELLRLEGAADVDIVDQLAKIADIQRTDRDEPAQARETYSEILDLEQDHLGAIRGLKELHRDDEQWMEVVDYLLREIPLAANESLEAQWEAKFELAEVYRLELDDLQEALQFYGEILRENPEYEPALEAVRQLLAEDDLARDAAMLLEPIFRDGNQPGPLAEALEARLRVCDDPFEEQELLDELIPLYDEEFEDYEQAFEYARRQFEIDPERDDIWLRFEQIGAKLDRWELIEEMFTRESPLEGHDSPTRYDLLRHLAAIREHRLQRPEEALEAWIELNDYEPFDAAVLEALERLHRQLDNPRDLMEVLRDRADLVEVDEDRIELLVEAGELLVEELGEEVEAIDVFRRVLGIDPGHDKAVARLRRLYADQQRWHDLDELLTRQADETLDPDERRDFLADLAELRYRKLDDVTQAVSLLCDLLDDDPGDDEIVEFAREVDADLAEAEDRPDLRVDLARTLEPVYRMRKEYRQLDEVLEVRLEAADDFEKVEILDEIVEVRQSRLSEPERAFEALGRAVVLEPEDEQRRSKLLEMAAGLECLEEAIDILADAAGRADEYVAQPIWKRLGELAADRLGDADRAVEYYDEALAIDETDRDVLVAQEELFEATSQSDRLCDNLAEQARFADPDRRQELLRRVATLQEHVLDRPVDAIETNRQLLEIDPDDLDAVEALERLYEERDQYFDLVELLGRKLELVDEIDRRHEILSRRAEVAEEELQDVDQAIDAYRRILEDEPDHPEALAEMDRLLADGMQWPEWTEVVRRRIEGPLGGRPDERLQRELKLAEVLVDELFEVEEALEVYRSILERQPDQPEAVEALEELARRDSWLEEVAPDLEQLYRRRGDWDQLVELYERRRDQAMDPHREAEHDFNRGLVLRDHVEDVQEAMSAFGEAWKKELDEERYRTALIELGTDAEAWDQLVTLLDEVLEVAVDPALTRELQLMISRLWREVLEAPMEAEDYLRDLLSSAPGDDEAFEMLREILEDGQRWYDLVDLLEDRHDAVVADDEAEAVELLMDVAAIQEEHLEDGLSAVETLRRVRSIDEGHGQAAQHLERLLEEQERFDDLAGLYQQRVETADSPDLRIRARLSLAELYRGPLNRIDRAVELYEEILEADAEHQEAVEALEELFERDDQIRADVGRVLEPIYRARGEDEALVEVLEARAGATEQRDRRIEWRREMLAILTDSIDAPRRAWVVAARLFSDVPSDPEVRRRLWALSGRARGWSQLAEIYETTLEQNYEIDDELRAEMYLGVAEIYADRLEDLVRGLEAAREAKRLAPEDEAVVDVVENLLERQEAWPDLAELYREQGNLAADPQDKRHWFEKLAALYEDVLDDIDSVVDVYGRLLEIAPGNEAYRRAMERVLATTERWYELADIYRQRIAEATDDEVVARNRLELAEVMERELGDVQGAVDQYRQVLQEDPGHSDAVRALEGLRRDLATRDEQFRPVRRDIIETLLEAYDHDQSWRRVDDLLEDRVELLESRDEKVETLVQKAELLMGSTNDDIERVQALSNLTRAYCLDPDHAELDETIEFLAEDLGAWQRIVPIYLEALGENDDIERQSKVLTAVARIYEERLDDIESAIAAYQQSVELSADSEFALEKLEELYGALEKWDALVEILERRLDEIYDGDRQQALRTRIARIYDQRLERPDEAIRLYRDVRREEPDELSHVVTLQRLYEQTGDYDALEELLLDKLQLVEADELRAETFRRLGELRRDQLEDLDGAIASFRDAREANPGDAQSLQALMKLYRSAERWHELLDVMASLRDRAGEEDANEIEVKMGDILIDELDDAERAFERYEAVLQRDRGDARARGAMFQLLESPDVRSRAAETLAGVYSQDRAWDELEALYQRIAAEADDPEYRAEQYLDLANLQVHEMAVPMKAFVTLSEAVTEIPEIDDIRERLEELAERLDSLEDLVPIYEETLQEADIDDPEVRRELHLTVGRGYAEGMGEAADAAEHFEAVLEIDQYDREALSWLDRIYQGNKDWPNLARILERKIDVVDGDELQQARFQLGYLKEVAYEEYDEALELYRRVIAEEPDHKGVVQGLERLAEEPELRGEVLELLEPTYRDDGDWAKLARLFELKLEVVDDPASRADLLREMATVQFEELDDIETAFQRWGQVLVEQPHDGRTQDRLEELADDHGFVAQLVDVYEDVIDAIDEPVRRLEIAEEGARRALEVLDDRSRAAVFYRAVLDVEPEHEEALEVLEDVARDEGDDESLAAVLQARVQSSFDEDEQIELYEELASVCLRIEDYEGAVEAFEQLQMLDGQQLERLETLADLYERTEQFGRRADTLETMLEYRDDEMIRHETLVEIGEICRTRLEEPGRARRFYEEALEIEPEDRQVSRALEDVYEQLEDFEALRDLLDRSLESVDEDDDQERVRLYIRRAEVRYEADDDVDGAIQDYQAAFEIGDDDPDVIDALGELYRAEERWEDVLGLLNSRINQAEDADRIADYYLEMAEIADERLDAPERAVQFAESVLEVDPADEQALDRLEKIHRGQQDWQRVVGVIDRRIEAVDDRQHRIELLKQRARMLHEDAGALEEAADTYERLLEETPGDDELEETLEEVYRELGAGRRLYELLADRVERADGEDRRVELLGEMADVAAEFVDDGDELRIEALESIREIRGDELDVVEPLLDAYIDGGLLDRAEPLLDSIIETLTDDRQMQDAVRFYHLRGKLAEQRGDDAAARENYDEAHRIDSTYIPNLLSLGSFHFERQQWEEAKKIYQILLLHQMNIDSDDDKLEVYFNLGMVREELGEEGGARDMYKRALRVDPDNETVQAAMEALDT